MSDELTQFYKMCALPLYSRPDSQVIKVIALERKNHPYGNDMFGRTVNKPEPVLILHTSTLDMPPDYD